MNSLYHLAILEGYLSNHGTLPQNVQDAIAYFKSSVIPAPVEVKKKKKRKMSPEQRERLLAGLNKYRAERGIGWTPEKLERLKELRSSGKATKEIAKEMGTNEKSIFNAVANHSL